MILEQKLTLGKTEKLKSKVVIDHLFTNGRSIKSGPIVLLWDFTTNQAGVPLQMGVSVPKRRFKKAVDRNRIKRQMREVYRTNQQELYQLVRNSDRQLAIFLLYRGAESVTYKALQGKIIVTLKRLEEELKKEFGDEKKDTFTT